MSRIVTFAKCGGPEVLEFKDVEVAAPEPHEVRIRAKALGINRAEVMFRKGEYLEDPVFPARLGYEVAGVVDAIGSNVTSVAVGDAVSVIPGFSLNQYGVYGELVLVPAYAVVKHPAALSFEEAASVWMMFVTAYGALVETAAVKKGDFVMIPAASSSVGVAAIQIASMVGATAIALTRTSKKAKQLLAAGAAHVIATEEQDLVAEVQRITGGKGARIVFDPVGGATFGKLIESMSSGGILVLYGALSESQTILPVLEIIGKQAKIVGYTLIPTSTDPVRQKAAVEFISDGFKSGKLKPVIAKTFPFDQIVESHRYLEANEQFGKVVVTV